MNLLTIRLLLLLSLCGAWSAALGDESANAPDSTFPEARLLWNNGEQLSGRLISAHENAIRWLAPEFEKPLEIQWSSLRRIEVAGSSPTPSQREAYRVQMRDGSNLQGTIQAMDAATLTLLSKRHGTVVLQRSEIQSFLRLKGDGLVYNGPEEVADWTEVTSQARLRAGRSPARALAGGPGGSLMITGCGTMAESYFSLPDKAEISWTLRSGVRPEFSAFLLSNHAMVAVQTWGDQLVLTWSDQFVSLGKLEDSDRSLTLRVFWDTVQDKIAVFTASGKALCPWQSVGSAKLPPTNVLTTPSITTPRGQIQLQSKVPNLTLESLRVQAWDGSTPSSINSDLPYLLRANGQAIQGEIVAADPQSITIQAAGGLNPEVVAWKDVDGYNSGKHTSAEAPAPQAELWFDDGTLVKGAVVSASAGDFEIATTFSTSHLKAHSTGLIQCNITNPPPAGTPPEPPLEKWDQITLGATKLHGHWVPGESNTLQWTAIGGIGSVDASKAQPWSIERAADQSHALPRPSAYFTLADAQIVPGSLESIAPDDITVDTVFAGTQHLKPDSVRFAQLNQYEQPTVGIHDAGWKFLKADAPTSRIEGETLHLETSEAYGHASLAQCQEISFAFQSKLGSMGNLRVNLFGHGLDLTWPHLSLIFANWSNTVYFGEEIAESQIGSTTRIQNQDDKPVMVRLLLKPNEVDVIVNDGAPIKFLCGSNKRSGLGFVLDPASLWGRMSEPLIIDHFQATPSFGQLWRLPIDAAAQSTALLVPRSHKDDPPRHILVAANGDLLRGELLSANLREFVFRSGLEPAHIPRNRVAGIAWLQKPSAPDSGPTKTDTQHPRPPGPPPYEIELFGGGRLNMAVQKFGVEKVEGDSPALGHCSIPIAAIYSICNYSPAHTAAPSLADNWRLQYAPEPVIPDSNGEDSPLVGKQAPAFRLPTLSGGDFDLYGQHGKVVVLDFWATWCGPCIRAMPELIDALSVLPADKVSFVAIDQGEPKDQVASFLQARGWNLQVALDFDETVGRKYNVEGIPHTIVIGPDGKVAWSHTGYSAEAAAQTAAAVTKLLKGG